MRISLNLPEETIQALHRDALQCPDQKSRIRLMAIYYIARRMTADKTAKLLKVSESIVDRWIKKFKVGGKTELLATHYNRQAGELKQKKDLLIETMKNRLLLSVAQVQDILQKEFNIKRQETSIRNFLHFCGFRYRKLNHVPGKSDPEEQEQWLKNVYEPALEECKTGKCRLLFSDAVHFVLGAFLTNTWACERLYIRSNTGRNRINVLGAVDAFSKEVTTIINTTYVNVAVVKDFMQMLHDKYNQKIYIVMDNARYQHCNEVTEFAKSLDIHILFLPPYSPNLNIIERLWKLAKKTVLYGKYFDSASKFHQEIRDFFESINEKYVKELKTLLSLKFQKLPILDSL